MRTDRVNQRFVFESMEPRLLLSTVNMLDYMPLDVGLYWDYDSVIDGSATTARIANVGTTVNHGIEATRVDTITDSGVGENFWGVDSTSLYKTHNAWWSESRSYLCEYVDPIKLPLQMELGHEYTGTVEYDLLLSSGTDAGTFWVGDATYRIVTEGPETVTTPAGTFEAMKLTWTTESEQQTYDWTCDDSSTSVYWFVSGLGCVQMAFESEAHYSWGEDFFSSEQHALTSYGDNGLPVAVFERGDDSDVALGSTWSYTGSVNGEFTTQEFLAARETLFGGKAAIEWVLTTSNVDGSGTLSSYESSDASGHVTYRNEYSDTDGVAWHMVFKDEAWTPASINLNEPYGYCLDSAVTITAGPLAGATIDQTQVGTFLYTDGGSITVPAGTFDTIKVLGVTVVGQTGDGWSSDGTSISTSWIAEGIGTVKRTLVSELEFSWGEYVSNDETFLLTDWYVPQPEIEVSARGNDIPTDGSETVELPTGYVGQGDQQYEFVIHNTGDAQLSPSGLVLDSNNGFSILRQPDTVVDPGDSTSIWLGMSTDTVSNPSCVVRFVSNDPDEGSCSFLVSGRVLPEPRPDLVGVFEEITLPVLAVPGDSGRVSITIANAGDAAADGAVTVSVYASQDLVLDPGDLPVGEVTKTLRLAPGAEASLRINVAAPWFAQPADYFLLAEILPDPSILEHDTDNNVFGGDNAGNPWDGSLVWDFGQIGNRTNVRVTLQDADGTWATFSATNGAVGHISTGEANRWDMAIENGNHRSAVTVKTKSSRLPGDDAVIEIGTIASSDMLGKFSGRAVDLVGGGIQFSGNGCISSIDVHDIADGAGIFLPGTGTGKGVTIKARCLNDGVEVILGSSLTGLTAAEWAGGGSLQTPWAGSILIKGDKKVGIIGDFSADITLTGMDSRLISLGKLQVAGAMHNSKVSGPGSFGGIAMCAVSGSDFLAGMADSVVRHATDHADFDEPAIIKSFQVKGIKGIAARFFEDTNVSASGLGNVSILNADFTIGQCGLYARGNDADGGIQRVSYLDTETGERWSWPVKGGLFAGTDDFLQIL